MSVTIAATRVGLTLIRTAPAGAPDILVTTPRKVTTGAGRTLFFAENGMPIIQLDEVPQRLLRAQRRRRRLDDGKVVVEVGARHPKQPPCHRHDELREAVELQEGPPT